MQTSETSSCQPTTWRRWMLSGLVPDRSVRLRVGPLRAAGTGPDRDMTDPGGSLASTGVLVTGATSGLGRAVAVRMAAAGADVALLGRNGRDLAEVAAEVTAYGVRAVPLAVDLVDSAAVEGVVNRVAADLGQLGVLVNAAGTDVPGSAEELSLADWERVVAVDLTAPFALTKAAMPHLRSAGSGLVVNISSVAGRRGWAGASAYCATKFALTGLTRSARGRGPRARRQGLRALPGGDEHQLGNLRTGSAEGTLRGRRRRARVPGPGRGGGPDRMDGDSAGATGVERGHRDPLARGRLAVGMTRNASMGGGRGRSRRTEPQTHPSLPGTSPSRRPSWRSRSASSGRPPCVCWEPATGSTGSSTPRAT